MNYEILAFCEPSPLIINKMGRCRAPQLGSIFDSHSGNEAKIV
jgi:hypothetical protein